MSPIKKAEGKSDRIMRRSFAKTIDVIRGEVDKNVKETCRSLTQEEERARRLTSLASS